MRKSQKAQFVGSRLFAWENHMKRTTKVDEVIEVTESIQEQASGKAIYENVCEAIGKFTDETRELHQGIDIKQAEILEIETEINQAEQDYARVEKTKDTLAQQIATQRTRCEVSHGSAKESEAASLLTGLLDMAEATEKAMEEAAHTRAEAAKNQPLLEALRKDIEDEQAKLAHIMGQLTNLEKIKAETFEIWGHDEEQAIIAEVEALQDKLAQAEQAVPYTRDLMREKQRSIASRLQSWPARAARAEQSHGVKYREEEQWSAEEHCLHAQIAFMEVLGKYGPKCRPYMHGRVPPSVVLQLPESAIRDLMNEHSSSWKELYKNDQWVRKHVLVDSAEAFIQHEYEARQPKKDEYWKNW
jgi:chromosome segregation ATPase